MRDEIALLFDKAALLPKGNWKAYNEIIRELDRIGLPADKRRETQTQIIEILEV